MKKLISAICILLCIQYAKANSVTIKLFNNSNYTIKNTALQYHNGSFTIQDHASQLPITVYPPGTFAQFYSGSAHAFCGTDGYIEFQTSVNNKTYQFMISFDNPFIGTNEYSASATSPFMIRHLNGGSGSDMVLSYELVGGPTATPPPLPPPLPINLPLTGNKTISGYVYWNSDEIGMPPTGDKIIKSTNYLTNAFKVEILAPTQFITNNEGTGSEQFSNMNGYYSNIAKLNNAKIQFRVSEEEENTRVDVINKVLVSKRKISFVISNLPENIPLDFSIKPKNENWTVGSKTPNKPAQTDARWMVFLHEKFKTENSLKYEIAGMWFLGDGSYIPDNIKPPSIEALQELKNKNNIYNVQARTNEIKKYDMPIKKNFEANKRPDSKPLQENRQLEQKTNQQIKRSTNLKIKQ